MSTKSLTARGFGALTLHVTQHAPSDTSYIAYTTHQTRPRARIYHMTTPQPSSRARRSRSRPWSAAEQGVPSRSQITLRSRRVVGYVLGMIAQPLSTRESRNSRVRMLNGGCAGCCRVTRRGRVLEQNGTCALTCTLARAVMVISGILHTMINSRPSKLTMTFVLVTNST